MAKMFKKLDKSDGKVYVIGAEKPIIGWDESDESTPSVNAGIVTTLTQHFFDEFNSLVLDVFQSRISHMHYEDYCTSQGLDKIVTINMCVRNQMMNEFKLDKATSNMKIKPKNNALALNVSGISMDHVFDYDISSDGGFISDSGKGRFKVDKSNIALMLQLTTNQNGVLQVDISDIQINLLDFDVSLDGSSDFSKAVEITLRGFKTFIKRELTNVLAYRLAKTVEESLNEILEKDGDIINLGSTIQENSNYWNITLLEDPQFTQHYISFVLDGSFQTMIRSPAKREIINESPLEFPRMPIYVGSVED